MSAPAQERTDQIDPASTGAYAIEVEGLRVALGKTPVLRGIDMHVPHGSVYGLVGPSGAGKSTLMRALATLQPIDSGIIRLDGILLSADPAAARDRIGYLPDVSGVYADLTVEEYLNFYGAIYRIPQRQQVSRDLLELVGLTERRDQAVGSLPRGMKQKLGLARCLIHDPDILLLDEPASGLDPVSRLELRDMLQELASFGKTILIASHLLQDLSAVCSHVGVIRHGEIVAEASAADLINAVFPDAHLRVRLLDAGDAETAARVLTEHPACRGVESTDASTLLATFDGGDRDQAAILGQLARSGVRVVELTVDRPTLEDAVLRLTAPERDA